MSSGVEASKVKTLPSAEVHFPIQELPPEVLIPIFKFLDLNVKKTARLVCQRWRCILDHPESKLVNFNTRMTCDANLDSVVKSDLNFDSLTIGNIKKSIWTNVTIPNPFARTREIILNRGNVVEIVMYVLKSGRDHVRNLKFDEYSLGNVNSDNLSKLLTEKKWDLLSDLTFKLEVFNRDWNHQGDKPSKWEENHVAAVECFLKLLTARNLRAFGFHIQSEHCALNSPNITRIMSAFMEFFERHSKTLRKLNMGIILDRLNSFREPLISTDSLGLMFSKKRQGSIAKTLKIENLYLQTNNFDIVLCLFPPCLWKLNTLTKFSWDPFNGGRGSTWDFRERNNPLKCLIENNRTTLTDVNIRFLYLDMNYESHIFNLIWLRDCSKLKMLSLSLCTKRMRLSDNDPQFQFLQVKDLKVSSSHSDTLEEESTWIVKTFPNLKTIDIRSNVLIIKNLNWLKTLLSLQGLVKIRYHPPENTENEKLDNIVREFVSGQPGLELKIGIQGKTGTYGLIKIISPFCLLN